MQFRDLQKQYEVLKDDIDKSVREVCSGAHYISGPQVGELEEELAAYVGRKHCITCANGTDAITLAIKAWGLGEGDAVFVPDFTFFSSGECPAGEGCTCVFVDVDPVTFNMDPLSLTEAIERTIKDGRYVPRAVVAVDLFGLPADHESIRKICDKFGLKLLEDAAQGFGGNINGKMACSFGDIAITSFFPAKPLGCYGDGGALFTDDDKINALLRSLAVHGKSGNDKYNNIRLGMNSRLDTLQAAVLLVKLKAFKEYELENVNKVADWYMHAFEGDAEKKGIILPIIPEGYYSSRAQFTIQLPDDGTRDMVQKHLKEKEIPSMIYYMKPMHQQGAFASTYSEDAKCPVTEKLCRTVLSLPIHPYMTEQEAETVAGAVLDV